ncbi:PTS fructose transporter subunit IIABC [Clostridium sp. JNZ J1-5]
MKITDLIKEGAIVLELNASSKDDVINKLVEKLYDAGSLNNKEEYKKAILERESQSTTGIGRGIAIPHAKTTAVKNPAICFGRALRGIDYDSLDGGPAKLFFMIAASEGAHNEHLETLSRLSTLLMNKSFRERILKANSEEEVLKLIDEEENKVLGDKKNNVEPKSENTLKDNTKNNMKILAVTACPTGIAHTYMAADALKDKANKMNIDIKVETNGSTGIKNMLTADEIKQAAAIIVAADKQVDMDRFHGKVVIQVPTSEAIKKPQELIEKALNKQGDIFEADKSVKQFKQDGIKIQTYKHLMNGVSNMLPFVVGGGILVAISFMLDINNVGIANYGSVNVIAKFFKDLGEVAFGFMLPVLAGFIASAIADRPALAPGFVGGALAASGGSGFLGVLAAGYIAGYIVRGLKKAFSRLPQSLESIKPVLLLPLFGILLEGFLVIFVINPPVSTINIGINSWLASLSCSNKIFLGLLLGGMMAIDMGGPINKAAYVFGVASIAEGNGHIMAAVMAGGMVPPLGIALATTFSKDKFTRAEREAGKTNYIMGLSFITEGAIPFGAADPKRVLPSIVIGSAVAGALSMIFGASSPAPHGGIFIFPLIKNWPMYLVSIFIGSVITALMINVLKRPVDV